MNAEMNIFIGSDLHCGHDVGLTPPEYNRTPPERGSAKEHKDYAFRVAGWEWFAKEVAEAGPFDEAIWNGDLVDGTGDKSGGSEDDDIPFQVEMAAAVINFVGSPVNHVNRGTPYHTGSSKLTWEDMVFGLIKQGRIGAEGHYNFNGLAVVAKHKIGNSTSPISKYTALSGAIIKQMLWAETGQQPLARLIIRSHIHRCVEVSDPAINKAAWVTPALQGLGSVYGAQVDGLPVHFGFLVLKVRDAQHWGVEAHIAPLEMQKASVYEAVKTA